MKILVVEDEPEPREGLCELLRKTSRDWELLPPCATGAEGLAAVAAHHPDLVITDIRLPDVDGLQMIGAFRQAGSRPQVIVLSGYPDFEYARKCLSLGVSEYLVKPSTASAMIEAVRTVENEHWTDAELWDCLMGTATVKGPGVLFLFQTQQPLTTEQKKTLRREVAALTGNPGGTLVSELPGNQISFFAKNLAELPPVSGVLETLKHRLHVDIIGGAQSVSHLDASAGDFLKRGLKHFLMAPSPGFLAGADHAHEFPRAVPYPYAQEKELIALLGNASPGQAARLLQALCSDLFRSGFDPEDSLRVAQKLLASLDKRIEALNPAKALAFQTLAPSTLLETALDHRAVVKIFNDVAAVFDLSRPPPEPKADHLKIQEALTLIERRLNNPPTLAECAAELGLSPEYLSRLFKVQMATGYSKYVTARRIERAQGLIASSRDTIQQIALSLGFQNAKYFCAIFRKETGMTPSEYRARFV